MVACRYLFRPTCCLFSRSPSRFFRPSCIQSMLLTWFRFGCQLIGTLSSIPSHSIPSQPQSIFGWHSAVLFTCASFLHPSHHSTPLSSNPSSIQCDRHGSASLPPSPNYPISSHYPQEIAFFSTPQAPHARAPSLSPTPAQFYKYTAPAAGFVVPWACSSAFDVTLFVDDGTGSPSCIGPFRGCNDPQITNVDSQTT